MPWPQFAAEASADLAVAMGAVAGDRSSAPPLAKFKRRAVDLAAVGAVGAPTSTSAAMCRANAITVLGDVAQSIFPIGRVLRNVEHWAIREIPRAPAKRGARAIYFVRADRSKPQIPSMEVAGLAASTSMAHRRG